MDNVVVVDNLNFRYNSNIVFKNLSFSIRRSSFTTVLGRNGSGKSTLVKLMTGFLDSNCSIVVDGVLLCSKTIDSIRNKVGVVFENPDSLLVFESVVQNLSFSLENMNYSSEYIYSRINDISSYLGISHLLNRNPNDLSAGEKQLVCLGCSLITGAEIIILDNAFSMVDDMIRSKILLFLKRIQSDFGTTIINFTRDIEDSLYGDDILIFDSGCLVIHDSKDSVYKQEKLLKKYDFDLPFMASLSNKLSYYGMLDDVILDMNEMVDLLWK